MSEKEQLAFQSEVVAEMTARRRRTLTAPVVLELDFSASQANPPELHTLAKNYIDLLETPVAALDSRRHHLWFKNDRKIKVLAVSYGNHLGGPSIRAKVVPLVDFRDNLALLERIRRKDFKEHVRDRYRSSQFDDNDDGDDDRDDHADERAYEELSDFQRNRPYWVSVMTEEGYAAMLQTHLAKAQQSFLARNDRLLEWSLTNLLSRPTSRESEFSYLDVLQPAYRRPLMTDTISLPLGHRPQQQGESPAFKQRVEAALDAFRTRWPFMFPLRTLLAVTILVVPSVRQVAAERAREAHPNGIDLDNLARKIVPIVHRVLLPPSTYGRAYDLPKRAGPTDDLSAKVDAAEHRFPKYSVTRYSAIELPRASDDPSEGFVRLMFGDGLPGTGLLDSVDEKVSRWERRVRRL